jgi:hypothetical protein
MPTKFVVNDNKGRSLGRSATTIGGLTFTRDDRRVTYFDTFEDAKRAALSLPQRRPLFIAGKSCQ